MKSGAARHAALHTSVYQATMKAYPVEGEGRDMEGGGGHGKEGFQGMTAGRNIRKDPHGRMPRIAGSSSVDPSAVVIGDVLIGEGVFVGPGAVVRADEPGSSIVIGERRNVQDRVIIHTLQESSVTVGPETSLAHGCVIHGPCRIGAGCFAGFGIAVFKASMGDGMFVGHLAVVEGVEVGAKRKVDSRMVVSSRERAGRLEPSPAEAGEFARKVVAMNSLLLVGYRDMTEG